MLTWSLLKLLPILLLSFVPVVGIGRVARSEPIVQPQLSQTETIEKQIQKLRTDHAAAIDELVEIRQELIPIEKQIQKLKTNYAAVKKQIQKLKMDQDTATDKLDKLVEIEQKLVEIKRELISIEKQTQKMKADYNAAIDKLVKIRQELIPLLQHPSAKIRRGSLETLGEMEERAGLWIPNLLSRLQDTDSSVRSTTVVALIKIGGLSKSQSQNLLPLLKDPDMSVRGIAALAVSRFGDSDVIPHLVPL
jgi:HEAT repeat protein